MIKKYLSGILVVTGLSIIASVVVPIGLAQLQFRGNQVETLIDPTATAFSVQAAETSVDYSQADSWFGPAQATETPKAIARISYYTVSVPSVGISGAKVEIYGRDLKKNAIQYTGTSLPGNLGNTVIFGHSTLPQLYRVNDPVSIFNPLLKVKVGDAIMVNYDGITYRYVVRGTQEVSPDHVEVLAQDYSKYQLTLITCSPLGTYLRRFVVRAELVS